MLARYCVTNMTPSNPQSTAPVSARIKRLFRMTQFSNTDTEVNYISECPGGASDVKQKECYETSKTDWQGIRQCVAAIRGYIEARHCLARQKPIEKLRDPKHRRFHTSRVNHLANGQKPTSNRNHNKRWQHQRKSVDRADSSEKLHVSGAERAEDVKEDHDGESKSESAQAHRQSMRSIEERVKEESAQECHKN